MKPRKIRRRSGGYRRSSFRHESQAPKILGLIALFAVIVVAGFFAGKLLFGDNAPDKTDPGQTTTTTTTTGSSSTEGTTTTTTTQATTANGMPTMNSVKAFYLPTSALSNTETLKTTLQAAKKAGFTGVVFDLKDATGGVWFEATGAHVAQAKSVKDGALTKEQLTAVLTLCENEQMLAMPRLYAFLDRTAPRALTSARIHYAGDPSMGWLDNSAESGGKPWLNPYSPQAHEYLIGLGTTLRDWGFKAVIYDGVQFPSQLWKAGFGDSAYTSQSKLEVLQTFTKSLTAAMTGCEVSICATGLGTIGESTAVYGGNPLSFGSAYLSPALYPSALGKSLTVGSETLTNLTADPGKAVGAAYRLVNDRIKLMTTDAPKLLPWLETGAYSTAQIQAEMDALGDAPFVLYNQNGRYDFTNLSA